MCDYWYFNLAREGEACEVCNCIKSHIITIISLVQCLVQWHGLDIPSPDCEAQVFSLLKAKLALLWICC